MQPKRSTINLPVFLTSVVVIILLISGAVSWSESVNNQFTVIEQWLFFKISWLYVLSFAIIFTFVIYLMFSRFGNIRLGPDHAKPEYSFTNWIVMLFSAGMGIGLMYYGVAEPVTHFISPPNATPYSIDAGRRAMEITFFHWGFHLWAMYGLVGLVFAYFTYRHNLPLLPRSALHPLIGDRIYGPIGHAVDTFTVIGTMFGVATSLGIGATQVNAGFNDLFGLPESTSIQIGLIAGITLLATISVVLGLDVGIKRLSQFNMGLAVSMLIVVIVMGPSILIMKLFVENTGNYLSNLVSDTFNLYAYQNKDGWLSEWTIGYWAWWISWSPFVGIFIARISRGRTIREFLAGVLLVPSLFIFLWFTVFGNTAINAIANQGADFLTRAVQDNASVALFKFFELFSISGFLSIIGVVLVITFFVTSSDSASLVVDTLTSGGARESHVWQRIFWALSEGVIAAILLAAGGLPALQTMTVISAFPIMLLLLVFCYSLFITLRNDSLLQTSVQTHSTSVQYSQANIHWKKRVASLINHPEYSDALGFIEKAAVPALTSLAAVMHQQGIGARLHHLSESSVRLIVDYGEVEDFAYEIRLQQFISPSYANEQPDEYYRAEVFLLQGGQEYDVFGYTEEQIIADAITQYEKHMHFLHLANSEKTATVAAK